MDLMFDFLDRSFKRTFRLAGAKEEEEGGTRHRFLSWQNDLYRRCEMNVQFIHISYLSSARQKKIAFFPAFFSSDKKWLFSYD
jgi:hypothetical protein